MCFEKLGHRFKEKIDITITSTYLILMGISLLKACFDVVTKDTGAILVAPLLTPVPEEFSKLLPRCSRKVWESCRTVCDGCYVARPAFSAR